MHRAGEKRGLGALKDLAATGYQASGEQGRCEVKVTDDDASDYSHGLPIAI